MTDHKELFKQPGISPSSINKFYESPSRFWRDSSYNQNRVRPEPTEAMIFGRLVHSLVLTPEAFDEEFAVMPVKGRDDLDTNDELKAFIEQNLGGKAPSKAKKADLIAIIRQHAPHVPVWEDKLAQFRLGLNGRTPVTQEQMTLARSMQDAMSRNNAVRQLIGNGFSEAPFCWKPDDKALMRKCRLDYVRSGLVIEYKTDIDPGAEDFSRTIAQRGYHRQIAFQMEAAKLMHGEAPRGGIIIAQDKELHDDIAIYALSAEDIATANGEIEYAIEQIGVRMASGEWRSFPEEIQPISLPRWYRPKHIAA